jgi:aldose 1-epimerase
VSEPWPPSGQQFEIRYADQVAVVTEVGATIRHYSVGDRVVLDGFDVDRVAGGGRGQHLIPWPNRIRDGRYEFAGQRQQLALTEPANGNAIHGLARWATWQPESVEAARVVMSLGIHPQPGWSGSLAISVTVELTSDGLAVTTRARNTGTADAPYGYGAHPYLTVGPKPLDPTVLQAPAGRYSLPDDRGIPVDLQPVDGTAYDFRTARPIGDLVLDTAYSDLDRDPDGRWRVHLSNPETGWGATVWADAAYPWLQLFTGDTLAPGQARAGLAVEPMTCGPDAFNTGAGLIVLAPGEEHSGTWGIAPS